MTVKVKDTRRAISEHSAITGDPFPMKAEVAAAALNAMGLDLGALLELPARYLGEHEDFPAAMAATARVVHPRTDFADWPFTCIDWTAAAAQVEIARSSLALVHGRHWFDMHGVNA